ncbi:MAG: ATP-binding protein [Acidimicrobiia bacterium]|nr:ATP-binding protein [Acidimicrobiia bacterium]
MSARDDLLKGVEELHADTEPAEGDEDKKPNQATILVELAESYYRLGADLTGEPHAVEHDGPNLARQLRGRGGLRAELADAFFNRHGKAPSATALADALTVLEGRAVRAEREPVALRVAEYGDAVVIDLGDPDGRCIIVEPGSWRIADRSPVLFRRSALTGRLPDPAATGDLDRLRRHVNVSDDLWPVLVGWLVAALISGIPHPILALLGEQGTAKTTTAVRLVGLIDNSPAPVRTAPRDPEQWVVSAAGSYVVGVDNISSVQAWLSDAWCRVVTGDGLVRRTLYSDGDLTVTALRRCLIITAIDAGALRGDLAERLVPLELERIPKGSRQLDAELTARWQDDHPIILAGLLDLVAKVLAVLPSTVVDDLPRMADFALVLAAIDRINESSSLDTYRRLTERTAAEVVDSDPVAAAVADLVADQPWSGTAGALLDALNARRTDERAPRGWPGSPRAMGGALRRCAPGLRAAGIDVDDERDSTKQRRRLFTIGQRGDGNDRPNSPNSPNPAPDLGKHLRTVGRTVATPTVQQSDEQSDTKTPADLGFSTPSDGSDGSDERNRPPSDATDLEEHP